MIGTLLAAIGFVTVSAAALFGLGWAFGFIRVEFRYVEDDE
jgi:hypothetical protein